MAVVPLGSKESLMGASRVVGVAFPVRGREVAERKGSVGNDESSHSPETISL